MYTISIHVDIPEIYMHVPSEIIDIEVKTALSSGQISILKVFNVFVHLDALEPHPHRRIVQRTGYLPHSGGWWPGTRLGFGPTDFIEKC